MKKQSSIHRPSRSVESESTITNFPAPALTGTQPRGLHTRDANEPMHLRSGAADTRANPVDVPEEDRKNSTESNPSLTDRGERTARTDDNQIKPPLQRRGAA